MPNPARLVSADELERMPKDDFRYELVRGQLIRMSPVAPRHGDVTVAVASLLWQHVRANRLGRVWTEVGFRLFSNPDTVLAPDVAFVRADRLPPSESRGFYPGAPDLAIEVLSPDDRPSDVSSKVRDYLAAGTPMAVIIDPGARTVTVHRPGVVAEILDEGGTLDFDPVVSAFRVSLAVLFE